jgi:hypothetical protein
MRLQKEKSVVFQVTIWHPFDFIHYLHLSHTVGKDLTMNLLRMSLFVSILLFVVPTTFADEKLVTVEGKIHLDGKPVPEGKIIFHLDKDEFIGAKVKNGSYTLSRVPTGSWTVTIEGAGIPAKFSGEEQSGLKVEVKEGKLTFDVELKSK